MRKWGTLALALLLLWTSGWSPPVAANGADTIQVVYAIDNGDFGQGLTGWDSNNPQGTTDAIRAVRYLELQPGAAIWQPIDVTNADDGPSVHDAVYAKVYATLDADVTTDDNVLVRLVAGEQLAEINSLAGVPRGTAVELTTSAKSLEGRIPAGQDKLWIELHNDTAGKIEVTKVEVWGVGEDGETKPYPLTNGDFSSSFDGNWEGDGTAFRTAAFMQPNAAAWRALPVGNGAAMPQPGDKVSVQAELFVPDGVNREDGVFVRVNDGQNTLLDLNDISGTARGKWFASQGRIVGNEGVVRNGAAELWIELHNETNVPVRLKGLKVTAERAAASLYDLNGDSAVDEDDAEWLAERVGSGQFDPRGDFDADGQLTEKDSSYFRKFALHRADEFYLNLKHFRFMNEDVTIDGIPMMVTHLYSEPVDRSDLSKGYDWVGDPQEGFASVDDVSRAVIAFAEHYGKYGDELSYGKIKRGLEFLMWMQYEDGDFDNFVVRDPDSTIRPKDSASSRKSFSWWAVRSYEAMAVALPRLKQEDAALAAKVEARLALCLKRLKEMTDPHYGQYSVNGAVRTAKWLLLGDTWLTSSAINALAEHWKAAEDESTRSAIRESVRKLAEGLMQAKTGDYRDYPYGGFMHHYDGVSGVHNWDEWNSIQVRAMAYAGRIAGNAAWIEAAEHAADSFLGDLLISGRAETMHPNKKPYPLIQYGTASYVDNLLALHEVTGKEKYAVLAGIAASWWTGNNVRGFPMFNQEEGYAYDGLHADEVNINSGAESLDEAIRALIRVLDNPIARPYLFARQTAGNGAKTIEAEGLYQSAAPPDEEMSFPFGLLNDPNAALVKQDADSGTDEAKVYEDALAVGEGTEIYPGWTGSRALFVEGAGHNNVRLFDGGSLRTELSIGEDAASFRPGDAVKLEFAARVEFDTSLRAEVYAVLANGDRVKVADANDMKYHARTWYSGTGAVRTTPVEKIPEGATKLEIMFAASSSKNPPHEGYAVVTEGKLYRMSVPEIRYSNTDLSGSSYVRMPPGQARTFDIEEPEAGTYDVMLSFIADPEARVSVGLGDRAPVTASLQGTVADVVQIQRIDTVELPGGTVQLKLENPDLRVPADIDALILYPVRSYAEYSVPGAAPVKVLRDSVSGMLAVGAPEQVNGRHVVTLDAPVSAVAAGSSVRLSGTVKGGGDGMPIAGVSVTVQAAGSSATATTDAQGKFAAALAIPRTTGTGQIRAKAVTERGEASVMLAIVPGSSGGGGGGGSSGGSLGVGSGGEVSEGVWTVRGESISAQPEGIVKLTLPEGAETFRLAGRLLEEHASRTFEFGSAGMALTVPDGLVKELIERAQAAGLKDWSLSLRMVRAEEDEASSAVRRFESSAGAKLKLAGGLYELSLSLEGEGGESPLPIREFDPPIRLTFDIGPGVSRSLLGVYYLGEDGSLRYEGGRAESESRISADVRHFSRYAVLEYAKAFEDVPASHWAHAAVNELAAKQIVQGVGERKFGTNAKVSRAEFASLIVRAFGLRTEGASHSFADVKEGSWYAEDVASAAKAGLILGKTPNAFDPGGKLTRLEAAIILDRLLKNAGGLPPGATALEGFEDAGKLSPAAYEAFSRLVGIGLMQGDDRHRLRPNDSLTRAEAAVLLAKLYRLVPPQD